MLNCRIPTHHKEVSYCPTGELVRTPITAFMPPVPGMMREPGTNYISILTSNGVITLANGQLENGMYVENAQTQVPTQPIRRSGK